MGSDLPPIPPRPDLGPDDAGLGRWHIVSPGRMRATSIVGAGLRLWSEHWVRWALVTLLFLGISTVIISALDPWIGTFGLFGEGYWWGGGPGPGARQDPHPLGGLITFVEAILLTPWLYVVLTKASLEASMSDAERHRLVGRTIRGVHSVLWIFLLLILCFVLIAIPLVILAVATRDADPDAQEVAVGIFFLVFLGLLLWSAPRLLILLHVFVGDDRRGTKAIAETWRRSRGAWGTALGVLVLNVLVTIAISLIPGIVVAAAFPLPTVEDAVPRAILNALVSALITPIGVAIGAALYLELSARKGVLDQATLRRNLARFDPA
jgi:hypothetical protein